jgi:hypothetical protein
MFSLMILIILYILSLVMGSGYIKPLGIVDETDLNSFKYWEGVIAEEWMIPF